MLITDYSILQTLNSIKQSHSLCAFERKQVESLLTNLLKAIITMNELHIHSISMCAHKNKDGKDYFTFTPILSARRT